MACIVNIEAGIIKIKISARSYFIHVVVMMYNFIQIVWMPYKLRGRGIAEKGGGRRR